MNNSLDIVNIVMFLFFSLLTLWLTSSLILEKGKLMLFLPFFIIGVSFAYFGAFIFFQMYFFVGWILVKTLEVFAFILLFGILRKMSRYG